MKYIEIIFAAALLLSATAPLAVAAPAQAPDFGSNLYAAANVQAEEDDADIDVDEEEVDEGEYVGDDSEEESDEDYEEEYEEDEEEDSATDDRG